jgi:hypothetical protein
MSRKLQMALRASMESDDVEILNPLTSDATNNIDEALANTTAEVVESAGEVVEADETVEALDDVAEAMESLQATLESCIAEGGMTPQTARTHNVAMALALRSLPLDVDRVTVSSESFGGHGDKMSASLEALEGVKAVLKRVLDAIVSAVKSAFEAVMRFFVTIRKSAPVIIAAANALKTKATALKGKGAAQVKMDAASAGKSFHIDGAFTGGVAAALKIIEDSGNKVAANAKAAAGEVRSLGGKVTSDGYDLEAEIKKFAIAQINSLSPVKLPGGKKVILSANGIPTLSSEVEFSGEAEIQTPSLDEVQAIAANAIAVAKFVAESDAKWFKDLQKSVESFLKAVEVSIAAVAGEDKEKAAALKASLAKINKLTLVARGCGPQFVGYMASSAKLAIQFGNQVLKQYGAAIKAA